MCVLFLFLKLKVDQKLFVTRGNAFVLGDTSCGKMTKSVSPNLAL